MASIFSFKRNQNYYTVAKRILDIIVGFVVGWMGFGFALWWNSAVLQVGIGVVLLALSILTLYYGRKWLGIAMIAGAVLTTAFYFYATLILGL